jgi:hypothetical protein
MAANWVPIPLVSGGSGRLPRIHLQNGNAPISYWNESEIPYCRGWSQVQSLSATLAIALVGTMPVVLPTYCQQNYTKSAAVGAGVLGDRQGVYCLHNGLSVRPLCKTWGSWRKPQPHDSSAHRHCVDNRHTELRFLNRNWILWR